MINKHPDLAECKICPHLCRADRYIDTGLCGASDKIKVNLHQLHFGEEPVLSGTKGSGTIFFSHCNLRCVFCQNHTISALGWGKEITPQQCLEMMFELQDKGAHNINLVTPGHNSVQLVSILRTAKDEGLKIPIVWNSNAYERVETLKPLEGLVDIYLPDIKYFSNQNSVKYSYALNYPTIAHKAVIEMKRQVGFLRCVDEIAMRGLIIRLLVLPDDVAGVKETLRWIADALGEETYISLMAQYYPTWRAQEYPEINRGITQAEYDDVLQEIDRLGFINGFIQELSCSDEWTPDFIKQKS